MEESSMGESLRYHELVPQKVLSEKERSTALLRTPSGTTNPSRTQGEAEARPALRVFWPRTAVTHGTNVRQIYTRTCVSMT